MDIKWLSFVFFCWGVTRPLRERRISGSLELLLLLLLLLLCHVLAAVAVVGWREGRAYYVYYHCYQNILITAPIRKVIWWLMASMYDLYGLRIQVVDGYRMSYPKKHVEWKQKRRGISLCVHWPVLPPWIHETYEITKRWFGKKHFDPRQELVMTIVATYVLLQEGFDF